MSQNVAEGRTVVVHQIRTRNATASAVRLIALGGHGAHTERVLQVVVGG